MAPAPFALLCALMTAAFCLAAPPNKLYDDDEVVDENPLEVEHENPHILDVNIAGDFAEDEDFLPFHKKTTHKHKTTTTTATPPSPPPTGTGNAVHWRWPTRPTPTKKGTTTTAPPNSTTTTKPTPPTPPTTTTTTTTTTTPAAPTPAPPHMKLVRKHVITVDSYEAC